MEGQTNETMRALAAVEPGILQWVEVPKPVPGPYQALVRIEVCGLCNNTDWQLATGGVTWAAPPPVLLGHESVGTVIGVGERVTKFRVGDRVTRVYAGAVGTALNGYSVFMGGFAEYGLVADGPALVAEGLATADDYTLLRQNVVPAGVSALDASLAISLAETASFVQHVGALGGQKVLVAGTGIAGLTMAYWAKLAGAARVVVLGRRDERLQQARTLAADATVNIREANDAEVLQALGGPADLFLEAVGDPAYTSRAAAWLAPGGAFAPYGLLPKDRDYVPLPAAFRMAPCVVNEHETYNWVIDLMQRGIVHPDQFRSHIWTPAEAIDGILSSRQGKVLKGFVRFA